MFRPYDGVEAKVDREALELDWWLEEADGPEDDPFYVEPEGMVDTALRELGACLVAVEQELPEAE